MQKDKWLFEISPKNNILELKLKEIWRYKDLLFLFVKRDVITQYKQTILGPLWYLIQPLFTSIIFTILFNNIASISTNGIPPFLFNLGGLTIWNYFKDCLTQTSDTFKKNEGIFGKVYFPRIIMPLSTIISNLLKFAIQFLIFILFYFYYYYKGEISFELTIELFYFPILFLTLGFTGLGLGMLTSSLVTKYRDFTYLIGFGVQLLMYLSAVVYPLELVKDKIPEYYWFVEFNPIAIVVESFRSIAFPVLNNSVYLLNITGSLLLSIFIFVLGLLIFNKTEKTFIDTV
jgi:lipopolysaccharide transport system permease protein